MKITWTHTTEIWKKGKRELTCEGIHEKNTFDRSGMENMSNMLMNGWRLKSRTTREETQHYGLPKITGQEYMRKVGKRGKMNQKARKMIAEFCEKKGKQFRKCLICVIEELSNNK